jgi:hypothetical protein
LAFLYKRPLVPRVEELLKDLEPVGFLSNAKLDILERLIVNEVFAGDA